MTPLGVVVAAPAVDGTGMRQRAALGLVQKLVAAVAAGSVAETWTPSQINSNCVLSNGDLTATFAGVAQANSPGFGTRAVTTGNFYWETTLVETSIASDDAGVASAIRRPLPPLGWAILPIRLTIAAVITASQGAQSFSMEFSV